MTASEETAAVGGHSPTPWAYRPQEHDDWGFIRTTVANAEGWHPVVAVAKYVGNPTDDDLGEHRRNKTDPSYANAALIVRAVNSHDALVEALRNCVTSLVWWRRNEPGSFGNVESIRLEAARDTLALAAAQAQP